ncbi:MAG: aldo/keto reductase [Leptolyngbya sp. SIO4C1]|nr:aldo/keto reductase [Leptolyngbya sp. SIO4C1]
MQTITRNNFSMPALGFGTYQLEGQTAQEMIQTALKIGYRHIDTAQIYGNEAEVGASIEAADVARDEIFLTTKVWVDRFSRERLAPSVEESLRKLRTDYVDLLLLHWPNPAVPLAETLDVLMQVKAAGQARQIGVSNFTTQLMQEAATICGKGTLVNNQVEYHPYLWQGSVIEQANQLGMTVTAYRPVAKGKIFKDETLRQIAEQHGKTTAQVALRWIIQQGIAAIPRTSQPEHAEQNFDIFDFELSADEMARIDALRGDGRLVSPDSLAPEWDQPYAAAISG